MRVFLISASELKTPYPVYPLGLDYLAGILGDRHRVEILDLNEAGIAGELDKRLKDFSPHIVGISLRNIDNTDAQNPEGFVGRLKELVRLVRQLTEAPVVLGGSGFSLFPREIMEVLDADYGIVGEGEPILPFLDRLERSQNVSGIPGLLRRNSKLSSKVPWQLPLHRHFDPDSPHVRFYIDNGGMLNLQTKRGCPFACIYCTYPHLEGKYLRLHPPEEVARTAKALQQAGAKFLYITDSIFNSDYDHCLDIARAFRKHAVSVPWGGFFSPTPPPEDFYRLLADSGLSHIEFGTDSMSDTMLAAYRKPFRTRDVWQAHRSAVDAGLNVAHYVILGGPGETFESVDETLTSIDNLDRTVLFFHCGVRIYPNTALYQIALEEGRLSESRNLLQPLFYEPQATSIDMIFRAVEERSKNRQNWVFGSDGEQTARELRRMYARGYSGPLWEYLIK